MTGPGLSGNAPTAVRHRGSHVQIIASAGSGKTEVVPQRIDPRGITAFTFTEQAADELKAQISARVEDRLGPDSLDRLGAAFVGTIHACCFRLLQRVPRHETAVRCAAHGRILDFAGFLWNQYLYVPFRKVDS